MLEERRDRDSFPTVEEVQDLVEKALIERGHARTAKAYIVYRYEHALKRAGRESLTYSAENIPYRKLWEALSWATDHGCVTVAELSALVTQGRARDLVEASEAFYESELDAAVEKVLARRDELRIIIVAGPSSSGKTTTTIRIRDKLAAAGMPTVPLAVDNYFFDLEAHPKIGKDDYDFETPQALDLALIDEHLRALVEGKPVEVPAYNFRTGRREGVSASMRLAKDEVLLIDSLHGLFPDMTRSVAGRDEVPHLHRDPVPAQGRGEPLCALGGRADASQGRARHPVQELHPARDHPALAPRSPLGAALHRSRAAPRARHHQQLPRLRASDHEGPRAAPTGCAHR